MSRLSRILLRNVSSHEMPGWFAGSLLEDEESYLSPRASAVRRASFVAGRTCARIALGHLGVPEGPIRRGPHGEPVWPESVVGSITHCKGYAAAAVGLKNELFTIGIDGEENRTFPSQILDSIALPHERAWIGGHSSRSAPWALLLFSAKESVYKAWFPIVRRWLDFHEVSIEFIPGTGSFFATVLPHSDQAPFMLRHLQGHYFFDDSLVLTSVCVSCQ